MLFCLVCTVVAVFAGFVLYGDSSFAVRKLGWWWLDDYPWSVLFPTVIWFVPPAIVVILFARHRLHAAVVFLLMTMFWLIIALNHLLELPSSETPFITALAMLGVIPLILLSVAPAKAISRRLIFLALGLLLRIHPA
jgi:hypothetical protein